MKRFFFSLLLVLSIYPVLDAQIHDIKSFLDQCPTSDPAIETILNDFEIRMNGILVTEFPCSEPVSAMDTVAYSNPLIYLQTLRVIYYMDRDMENHLPWTHKTLYEWLKDGVDGINIVDGVSGGYCCSDIDGKIFFVTANFDGYNREFDKTWKGISGNIDFFAHEVRHTDPDDPGHTSCCGITNGCDQQYNESNLGAYGVQYWLVKSWLTGFINVGARTSHSEEEIDEIINWHLESLNTQFRERFCESKPPTVYIGDIEYPLGPGYVSAPELIRDDKVNLFPNPVKSGDELTISIPGTDITIVEIYDVNGRLVETAASYSDPGKFTISMAGMNPGYYIVKIRDSHNKEFNEKLIIR